jgi:hypothetical protein
MNEFHLSLNLFSETTTYTYFHKFEFIIDLCLIIELITKRVLIYQHCFDFNHKSNRAFIETILNVFIINASSVEQFNWSKLNLNKLNDTLNHEFFNQFMSIIVTSLKDYAKQIHRAIFVAMMMSISKFATFSRIISSFNSDCEAIRIKINQIRRNF